MGRGPDPVGHRPAGRRRGAEREARLGALDSGARGHARRDHPGGLLPVLAPAVPDPHNARRHRAVRADGPVGRGPARRPLERAQADGRSECPHPAEAGGRPLAAPRARRETDLEARPTKKGAAMCRWMAWSGQPLLVEELLFKPTHGLIDQSLHSRLGVETTNGDGFGLGWYGAGEGPGIYHSVSPAWGDTNLRELAAHIESPLFLAHVRAAIGSPIQATNCHPFRRGRWLFVHNGFIADFHLLR